MPKIVGRNATGYAWQLFGADGSGGIAGSSVGMLGRWKTVTFNHKKNWTDSPTSSDATEPERVKTMDEWSGSLKSLMDANGSQGLLAAYNTDYIQVSFTVSRSGTNWRYVFTGGIDESDGTFEQDAATDDLKLISVGGIPVVGVPTWQIYTV